MVFQNLRQSCHRQNRARKTQSIPYQLAHFSGIEACDCTICLRQFHFQIKGIEYLKQDQRQLTYVNANGSFGWVVRPSRNVRLLGSVVVEGAT